MVILVFYDNYVRLCNSVHKSPSAVAIEIGIAKPTVSMWKAGSTPNHATVLKVADYFGVTASELIEEQKENSTSDNGVESSELRKKAHKLLDTMSEEELEAAWHYIRKMLEK